MNYYLDETEGVVENPPQSETIEKKLSQENPPQSHDKTTSEEKVATKGVASKDKNESVMSEMPPEKSGAAGQTVPNEETMQATESVEIKEEDFGGRKKSKQLRTSLGREDVTHKKNKSSLSLG